MEVKRLPELWQWIQKLAPRELLVPDDKELPPKCLLEGVRLLRRPVAGFDARKAERRLLEAQSVQELAALGLQNKPCLVRACGALLVYLEQTQKRRPEHLMPFQPLDLGRHMLVDDVTERNLEIFQRLNGRKGKGTLRHVLDDTMTPMAAACWKTCCGIRGAKRPPSWPCRTPWPCCTMMTTAGPCCGKP